MFVLLVKNKLDSRQYLLAFVCAGVKKRAFILFGSLGRRGIFLVKYNKKYKYQVKAPH